MPNAHRAYRPHTEVELLEKRAISLDEAIRGLQQSIACTSGASSQAAPTPTPAPASGSGASGSAPAPASNSQQHTPGSALISYEQIPKVLDSLTKEWTSSPEHDRSSDCFYEVRGRLTAHMHPCFLGAKLMQGMREAAGHLLMRQNRVLDTVPLGFKELKPANTHGAVVGESAYVHFLIEFRCIGFRPKPEMKIIGRLGEHQTAVGLNCSIFNIFNFFVPKGDLPQEAWFDGDVQVWMLGEKKLVSKKTRGPLCLQIKSEVKEETVLGFKGVLAHHLPASGLRPYDEDAPTGSRRNVEAESSTRPPKKRKSDTGRDSAAAEAAAALPAAEAPKAKKKRKST